MRDALSPYRAGFPTHPALSPGTVISSHNWQIAQDVLPPEILTRVQEGDFSIEVAPTQDFPLHKRYRAATLEHAAEASLDEHGNLTNYTAGLPFPVLDPSDAQAGLKLAWNLRFRSLGGDTEELQVMLTMLQGAEVEGSQEMRMQRLRISGRYINRRPERIAISILVGAACA